jgi:hypothetical protein
MKEIYGYDYFFRQYEKEIENNEVLYRAVLYFFNSDDEDV